MLYYAALLPILPILIAATAIPHDQASTMPTPPNFIFILTDDQDRILGENGYSSLGSMEIMPNVQSKLIDEGAIVENFLVNTPICCPSRTEFFTGRYFHNVRVEKGGCMHADTSYVGSNTTGLFGVLKQNGYNVGLFGKITNDQEDMLQLISGDDDSASYIDSPISYNSFEGKDYWRYWSDNDTTYTETISKKDPIFGTPYQTAQLGNRTLRWLDTAIKQSMTKDGSSSPFFAYIGPHAPHFPAQPAPWYEHAFDDICAPITPNYNASSPGKPTHIQQNPPLDDRVKCWEDQEFRDRWATLLSVDDMVNDIYDYLDARQALENTYIVYSSDHGYKLGQWRIGTHKSHPYETDIRVPFIIRGPGIEPGTNITTILGGNVDLMPTILDLAGVTVKDEDMMDGKSMKSVLLNNKKDENMLNFRQYFLNEYESVGTHYNNKGDIWQDGTTTSERCGTPLGESHGPLAPDPNTKEEDCVESEGIGDGNCWMLESKLSLTYRQLRIMNESMNWNYVEYDPTWEFKATDPSGAGLQHYELYDVQADPYQLENIYPDTSIETRTALHQQLDQYFQCKGQSCP